MKSGTCHKVGLLALLLAFSCKDLNAQKSYGRLLPKGKPKPSLPRMNILICRYLVSRVLYTTAPIVANSFSSRSVLLQNNPHAQHAHSMNE